MADVHDKATRSDSKKSDKTTLYREFLIAYAVNK